MLTSGFPKEVASTLQQISPDIVRTEQYMDFLRSRFFRRTLLCHAGILLRRDLGPHSLNGLLLASPARPEADQVDLAPGVVQTFRMPSGAAASSSSAFSKAALAVLGEHWPQALGQEVLYRKARERLDDSFEDEPAAQLWSAVLGDLLHCYASGLVELRTWQAGFTTQVSDQPRVSTLAAYQAARGEAVVNQRHEPIRLDAVGKELLRVLDGARDHAALVRHLRERVAAGALAMTRDGQRLAEETLIEEALQKAVQETLRKLAAAALLTH